MCTSPQCRTVCTPSVHSRLIQSGTERYRCHAREYRRRISKKSRIITTDDTRKRTKELLIKYRRRRHRLRAMIIQNPNPGPSYRRMIIVIRADKMISVCLGLIGTRSARISIISSWEDYQRVRSFSIVSRWKSWQALETLFIISQVYWASVFIIRRCTPGTSINNAWLNKSCRREMRIYYHA